MATRSPHKTNLSNDLLQMKFMKKSALRIEKEKSKEEIQQIIDDEHWVLDLPDIERKESKYIEESSYGICENLQFGRMSFKGFNPEIEKLMQSKNNDIALKESERKEKENSVDDKEMAERYQTLIGTVASKFKTKRQQYSERIQENQDISINKKIKREFKRPADD